MRVFQAWQTGYSVHVFTRSSDWFKWIACTSAVIGQRDYFGLSYTRPIEKKKKKKKMLCVDVAGKIGSQVRSISNLG